VLKRSALRSIKLAALLAAVLVIARADSRPEPDFGVRNDVMIVYVGSDSCAPCRAWQRNEAVQFRASPAFSRISYREIKAPNLFDLLKDEWWPEDLRGYRSQLARGAGAPLWLLIVDRQIVAQAFGRTQWSAVIEPQLRMLLWH